MEITINVPALNLKRNVNTNKKNNKNKLPQINQ